jgi:hypothetical protein
LPRVLQLDGVWFAFPISDALTFILVLTLLIPQIRDLRRLDSSMKNDDLLYAQDGIRGLQPVAVTEEVKYRNLKM